MKPVAWMVGVSMLSCVTALAVAGTETGLDIFLGMIGPLAVATTTWLLTERTYRRHPERVTSLMVAAFASKMVFFGAYVIVVLRLLSPRFVPFVVSFTSYFIALYLMEALSLRRLFAR